MWKNGSFHKALLNYGPLPRVDCWRKGLPRSLSLFQDRGDFVKSAVPILAGAVPMNYDISYLEDGEVSLLVCHHQPGQPPIHKEFVLKLVLYDARIGQA